MSLCRCPVDCYCKEHTCKDLAPIVSKERAPYGTKVYTTPYAIMAEECRRAGLNVRDIKGKVMTKWHIETRRRIAQRLYEKGLSTTDIAKVMKRKSHTAALGWLGRLGVRSSG